MTLADQVAVVTGATRGIGRAVTARFVEEGAKVVGVYHASDEAARELQTELADKAGSVHMVKGSVDNRDFVRELMSTVESEYGKIDILVNNAGIVKDNFVTMMTPGEWNAVFQTNFQGTFHCCVEAVPHMVKNRYGRVINVVSVTGVYGREAQVNYGSSKGAVIGLTRLLARRYTELGIRFNAVAPGMIQTEMIGKVPPSKMEGFLAYTQMKRTGRPEEVADAVAFLASPNCSYLSDTVLKVDGGFMR